MDNNAIMNYVVRILASNNEEIEHMLDRIEYLEGYAKGLCERIDALQSDFNVHGHYPK